MCMHVCVSMSVWLSVCQHGGAYYVCVCVWLSVCQYGEDMEDEEFPRPRLQRAGKRKSAKKPITQVWVLDMVMLVEQ